jgi:sodium transport system permease protein
MFARIWIVFVKEVIDNLRDRRSIFSTLLSPLLGPVILLSMIILVGKTLFTDINEKPLKLPVVGAENAPTLIQYLKQNDVDILPGPANPEALVQSGDLNLVLIISPEYGEAFTKGESAPLRMVIDSSRQSALADIERARTLIYNYAQQISALRLMARGINPMITNPVTIERIDVATPQSQVLIFLNMMPYFIILTIFVGGMYVIIDATAGERERGSLEPLLINPVKRMELVLGKMAASLPFATFTLILTLAAFSVAFNLIPLEEYVGFQMTIDFSTLWGIFWISLPIIFLASALQMVVAAYTRSFKEAQTYLPLLSLIPAMPGIFLAFLPVKPELANMLIPTFGQQLLINQLMRGETLNPLNLLVSTAATLALTVTLVIIAIKLYQREKILFSK